MTTLITGGAGFLGRAIMFYMADEDYVVYSRDETKQEICKRRYPYAKYVLGDVRDYDRLAATIDRFRVDTVVHAGAMKYIPEAEHNVMECIAVNLEGSINVLNASMHSASVTTVVGISTDKAVEPINTYGMTKALMERAFGEFAAMDTDTSYALTRYGNVVGSTGSVIPLFEYQLKSSGHISVTNPNMTRFWISAQQAVQLVDYALRAPSGCIVVPKAQAMRLGDLANMLSKFVHIIGPRPGEKVHERLIGSYESVRASDCGDHYLIGPLGSDDSGSEFVLSSGNPHVWLDEDTMRAYIEDAKCV